MRRASSRRRGTGCRSRRTLDSADHRAFTRAIWPAQRLRIPTRQRISARLHTRPHDAYLWHVLLRDCPPDEIAEAVALAEHLLPLADLGTGPTGES